MKKQIGSKHEKVLFVYMITLLFMCGVAFDYEVNRGLFRDSISQPTVAVGEALEQLSYSRPIDFTPITLGVIIILLIVLRKENIINMKKIEKIARIFSLTINKFIKKHFIFHIKRVSKKAAKIPKIDVVRIVHKASKIRPHKTIKAYYHLKLKHIILKEFEKTKDIFTKPYDKSYSNAFISMIFIFAVVGMAIFAMMPSFNHAVISFEKPTIAPVIVEQSSELLSPGTESINAFSLLAGIAIIALVSIMKIKKEAKKK